MDNPEPASELERLLDEAKATLERMAATCEAMVERLDAQHQEPTP